MTLDPGYLQYAKRAQGMDHVLYPWSNLFERAPVAWPDGKTVAIWPVISLEWFPIVPSDTPFRAPGHMQTAYPDFRHYTAREYGSRIGLFRLLDAFEAVGAKISVACNGAIAERYPAIIEALAEGGHEIIAHSTDMNGTIAGGLSEDDERDLILHALDMIEKASGKRPRGWLSIARSQSFNTPGLLAKAGLDYMCDWVNDELPYQMQSDGGAITNIPLNHELSDRQILNVQQQSVDSYAQQFRDAHQWLAGEASRFGGRMLPMHLTPYIMGLPYRIDAFEELLRWLADRPESWFATGSALLDSWSGQQ